MLKTNQAWQAFVHRFQQGWRRRSLLYFNNSKGCELIVRILCQCFVKAILQYHSKDIGDIGQNFHQQLAWAGNANPDLPDYFLFAKLIHQYRQ